jgi:hypothetical protein
VTEIDDLRAPVEELERRVEILFTKTGAIGDQVADLF